MFDQGPGFLNSQQPFPSFIDYPSLKRMRLEVSIFVTHGNETSEVHLPGAFPRSERISSAHV
jgi:hypothetical protein